MEKSMPIAIGAVIVSIVAILSAAAALVIRPTAAIGAGDVGTAELADNSVTGDKIADGTITDADIASEGISRIADNAITEDMLSAEALAAIENIADNSITSAMVKDGNIDTVDLADNSVTSEKIADDTIVAEDIATGGVTTDEIADDTITAADIAAGAVTTTEILDGTIATQDIGDSAVTYDKMAIKIKCGLATNVVHGSTINHNLGVVPTSVVATPVWDSSIEAGNAVLHVNVENVTANSFDVALWIEIEGKPPILLDKVDGIAWPPENIYWIAVYSP